MGALGWRGEGSQTRRFEVIAGAADFTGASVLDLGCGYGDLCGFLNERFADFAYIGLDQMPEFVGRAREMYGGRAKTWFHECDFSTVALPCVDYVVASGALNYRCDAPGYHEEVIRRMYAAAGRALVFNVLDADMFPDHPLLIGHDVEAVVAVCRELSQQTRVVRGYADDDATICVYRV